MSLRATLKRQGTIRGRRWTIRRDKDNNLTDVKMIFNPEEYITMKNARPMIGDKALIKVLEAEREKKRLVGEA